MFQNLSLRKEEKMDNNQFSPPVVEGEVEMSFPDAIKTVIEGKRITRTSWNDINEYGLLADGWLTIHTKGKFAQWIVNSGDLEGIDWKNV